MNSKWALRIVALSLGAIFSSVTPLQLAAQDQAPQESASRRLWPWLKEGKISFNTRFRFEGFQRDGAPFTATAYAPTLRLALGYETPAFHGFSVFAQGESVFVTGPADYSVPLLPLQNCPNLPAILDPRSLEMNQGYVKWTHGVPDKKLALTVGRQELTLNDGRFLNISNWRQIHGTFDAVRLDTVLPLNFSFTYAFINRFYREDGYNASDGEQPMHFDMWNLAWRKPDEIRIALYGLLLNFRAPAQLSQQGRCELLFGRAGPGLARIHFQGELRFARWPQHYRQIDHPARSSVQRLDGLVFQRSQRGRRQWPGSPLSDRERADTLSGRGCRNANLLRLPLGQPAHPLWQGTGFGHGLQGQTRERPLGNRMAVRPLLVGSSLHTRPAHVGLHEFYALRIEVGPVAHASACGV